MVSRYALTAGLDLAFRFYNNIFHQSGSPRVNLLGHLGLFPLRNLEVLFLKGLRVDLFTSGEN